MSNQRTDSTSRFMVIGIASVVALVVLAVVVYSNRPTQSDASLIELIESLPQGIDPINNLPYLGSGDAPVTMLIYEDLGCPNCKTFFETIEPNVIRDFVVNGDVRIMIYTLAFVNQQSLPSAEGLTCAKDQGKFWEYRDTVFHNQGVRVFNRENLIAFADEIGLDMSAFSRCFDFGTHTQAILDASNLALDFGITGTPTTEVNGVRHVGVIGYEQVDPPGIRLILEEALASSGE